MKLEKPTYNQKPKPDKANTFKIGYGDYLRFRELILKHSGLHFSEKKRGDLENGLLKAMASSPRFSKNGQNNLQSYYNLLCDKNNPTGRVELERLINILTINETYFFRDEAQMDALTHHILPTLISRKRAAAALEANKQPQLRIWSAGCATGEEPYSIAIMLKELLPDIKNWKILILGTDINQEGLNQARQAIYSSWAFRENRAKRLRRQYFIPGPNTHSRATTSSGSTLYRLNKDIQQMVTFNPLNLVEDVYPTPYNNTGNMDLILCRNVTIYFTQEITHQITNRFYKALVEGGWLVVGHSEPSLVGYRDFQVHTLFNTILYQKTNQPTTWPTDWDQLDNTQKPMASTYAKPQPAPTFPAKKGKVSAARTPLSPISSRRKSPLVPPASPPANPSPVKTNSYEKAKIFVHKGQPEAAIKTLHRKLAASPDFAPAHTLLGRTYANLAEWEEARRWCQSALKLDSLQTEAYHTLALIYQHEGNTNEAIKMLKKVIYINRDVPLTHFNLATLYKSTGQINNAKRAYRNTIKILGKWPPHRVIPDSGGATAKRLMETSRKILATLNNERKHT